MMTRRRRKRKKKKKKKKKMMMMICIWPTLPQELCNSRCACLICPACGSSSNSKWLEQAADDRFMTRKRT
jgi:hypothetical protein